MQTHGQAENACLKETLKSVSFFRAVNGDKGRIKPLGSFPGKDVWRMNQSQNTNVELLLRIDMMWMSKARGGFFFMSACLNGS